MATTTNRLLLNLGVFRASTARTSLGAFSSNYALASASITSSNITLAPGQVYTFNVPSGPSTVLALHTTAALRVDAELEAFDVTDTSGVTMNARGQGTQVFKVASLLVIDDAVTALVIENISATSANVTIHQG